MTESVLQFEAQVWQALYEQDKGVVILKGESNFWLCGISELAKVSQIEIVKWSSLLFFSPPFVVIGYFPNPRLPQIKGLECFEFDSGKTLWQNEWAVPTAFFSNGVQVLIEERPFFLGLQRGEPVSSQPVPYVSQAIHPDIFLPDDEYFNTVSHFFYQKTQIQTNQALAYFQTESLVVIHSAEGVLLICDPKGNVLHRKQYPKGNFFIQESKLYLIADKQIIFLQL
jgi:hypothetical protein